MEDSEVIARISQLVDEEHRLYERAGEDGLDAAEQERLHALEVALDQLWDYLRQRRARRQAGADPDEAKIRDESVVERYQQ
jgi:hypothetical protein